MTTGQLTPGGPGTVFTGDCTCKHEKAEHAWLGCMPGCTCTAGWDEE
jgi:hypothetical protein